MADVSKFGRRTDEPVDECRREKSKRDERQHLLETGMVAELAGRSFRLSAVAQILTFVALIIVFVAATLKPFDPADLRMLNGSIYVPEDFAQVLNIAHPKSSLSSVPVGLQAFPRLAQIAALVLTLIAALAIARGRWVLGGLSAVFLAAPWGLLGFDLPQGPYALAILMFSAFAFHAPVRRRTIILATVLGTLTSPLILGIIADASKHLGVPQTYAKYRLYKPADLVDTALDRSSVLDGGVKWAIAYIAAQGAALRGDAQAAAVAVRQLKETTLPTNRFDQERIEAIHRFTIVSGAFGIPTQERFWAEQAEQTQKPIFLILAACVFAAVAMLTSSFGRGITRRGFRISSIEAELRRYRGMPWAGTRNKDGGFFGRRTDTVPASVMSGESAMDAISSRLRVYVMLCAGCCSISILCQQRAGLRGCRRCRLRADPGSLYRNTPAP
jgi:hypothetical protein